MTNTALLKEVIEKSGLKRAYIASQLGLSVFGLQKKIENTNQFKAEEIKILCKVLNITSLREKELIFFADNVDKMATQ